LSGEARVFLSGLGFLVLLEGTVFSSASFPVVAFWRRIRACGKTWLCLRSACLFLGFAVCMRVTSVRSWQIPLWLSFSIYPNFIFRYTLASTLRLNAALRQPGCRISCFWRALQAP